MTPFNINPIQLPNDPGSNTVAESHFEIGPLKFRLWSHHVTRYPSDRRRKPVTFDSVFGIKLHLNGMLVNLDWRGPELDFDEEMDPGDVEICDDRDFDLASAMGIDDPVLKPVLNQIYQSHVEACRFRARIRTNQLETK